MYKKICTICKKAFETKHNNKQICSFECKQERRRQISRYSMRANRHPKNSIKKLKNFKGKFHKNQNKPCAICGYKETIDLHHEGKQTYFLCPNHHALITRNIKTIEELLI